MRSSIGTDRDAAFTAYVREHRAELVRTARLLAAGDGHLAEDLVQASLTKLYLAWPRVRAAGGPHAYARRVLVNTFIDETRRPSRRRERSADHLPDRAAEPGLSHEDQEAVRLALAQVPPRMRAALVLRHWLQLDVGETAAALGCSTGTVKSQTARGLDHMRALLREAFPEPDPAGPPPAGTQAANPADRSPR